MRRAAAAVLLFWIVAPFAGFGLPAGGGGMSGMACCVQMGDHCECRVLSGLTQCPEASVLPSLQSVPAVLAPDFFPLPPPAFEAFYLAGSPELPSFSQPPSTPPPRS